jgi:hypothetical protein
MLILTRVRILITALSLCASFSPAMQAAAGYENDTPVQPADNASAASFSLTGAWKLVRCDNVYPDGHRIELYGPNPDGLWLIDAQGNYTMQIVRAQRNPFAAKDKSKGTPEEYRAASLDFNAHYGHVSVDGMKMHVHIDHASFPNWDGRDSASAFTLKRDEKGDELTYAVGAPSSGAAEGAKGEVVWRRQAAMMKSTQP